MKKLLFLTAIVFNVIQTFAQLSNQDYIITTEQYGDGTKRREIYYTKDFKKIAETYFYNNKKIASIVYNKNNEREIEQVEGYDNNERNEVITRVDFIKGIYEEPNKLRLSFKGRFIFDGIQEDIVCDVWYRNGVKSGKFNQRSINVSSGEFAGKRSWQYELDEEINNSSLRGSRGLYELTLNFDNNVLNGLQTLSPNSEGFSFTGLFNYGKVLNYQSFLKDNQTNNAISVIKTDKQIINSPQILNGTLWQPDGNYALYFQHLSQCGNIVNNVLDKEYFKYGGERSSDFGDYSFEFNFQAKNNTDSLKMVIKDFDQLRRLIGIPMFKILKYSLENNDEIEIVKIKLDNCALDTNQNSIKLFEQKFKNNIYYLLPPFKTYPHLSSNFNVDKFSQTAGNTASFINWFRTSYGLKFSLIHDEEVIPKDEEDKVENNFQESISNLFQKKTIKQFRRIGGSNESSFLFFQNSDTLELIHNRNTGSVGYDRTQQQYFCNLRKLNSIADYYSYNYFNEIFYDDKQLVIDSNLDKNIIRNIFLFYPGTIKEIGIAKPDTTSFNLPHSNENSGNNKISNDSKLKPDSFSKVLGTRKEVILKFVYYGCEDGCSCGMKDIKSGEDYEMSGMIDEKTKTNGIFEEIEGIYYKNNQSDAKLKGKIFKVSFEYRNTDEYEFISTDLPPKKTGKKIAKWMINTITKMN